VRWRLVFARRCLLRARSFLADPSPFSPAEAVSAAQDGVELVLRAIVDQNRYDLKDGNKFDKLVDAVPAASPYRSTLMALNQLRVQAKHHGMAPDRAEAARQVESALGCASEISRKEPPEIDVLQAFLASTLRHRLLAAALEEAERFLEAEGDRETFAIRLSHARGYAMRQAEHVLALDIDRRPFDVTFGFRDHATRHEEAEKVVGKLARATENILRRIDSHQVAEALGLDRREELLLRRLLPKADRWSDKAAQLSALTPTMRSKLFLAVVRMAECAEDLDVTIPIEFHERLQHVEALMPAEARLHREFPRPVQHASRPRPGRSARRPTPQQAEGPLAPECPLPLGEVVGHLEVGKHYQLVSDYREEARLRVLMFGLTVVVPREAVRMAARLSVPQPVAPTSDEADSETEA